MEEKPNDMNVMNNEYIGQSIHDADPVDLREPEIKPYVEVQEEKIPKWTAGVEGYGGSPQNIPQNTTFEIVPATAELQERLAEAENPNTVVFFNEAVTPVTIAKTANMGFDWGNQVDAINLPNRLEGVALANQAELEKYGPSAEDIAKIQAEQIAFKNKMIAKYGDNWPKEAKETVKHFEIATALALAGLGAIGGMVTQEVRAAGVSDIITEQVKKAENAIGEQQSMENNFNQTKIRMEESYKLQLAQFDASVESSITRMNNDTNITEVEKNKQLQQFTAERAAKVALQKSAMKDFNDSIVKQREQMKKDVAARRVDDAKGLVGDFIKGGLGNLFKR